MRWRFDFVVALFAVMCLSTSARSDDYARIARLSFTEGHVSFQHPSEVDWAAASINLALQPGDRVYTGNDGRAEIEFDEGSVLRLAENTDVELVSMDENLVQLRVLVGLCTLTRHDKIPFDVSTPAALFHTLHQGVYRFDVTQTGDSDGIVRKGSMQALGGNFSKEVGKNELIHVEAGDQSTPVISRYEGRDGWDEWTDRRTADEAAYVSTRYVPDYVYMGVNDLDRYGQWVDVGVYGYGWVPSYMGAGWSPYYDGRWCYRPNWGWTWVSYEPWGWLPYHYGSWYFSSFGWCWLPGPSFGFRFWSPGLVRFYDGPGWVSWTPLGPGDYYSSNNYWYAPRYRHYLNDMRSVQRRDPDDLVNRHVPGAFRTEPMDQFVNGAPARGGAGVTPVVEVSQPWRSGRLVKDRLDVKPTARSYDPAIPGRTGTGPATTVQAPAARSLGRNQALTGSTAAREETPAPPVAESSRGVERTAPGNVSGTRSPEGTGVVRPGTYPLSGGAAQNSTDRQVRIWNRVDEPATGSVNNRTGQPGQPATGAANPRSAGREIGGQAETGRGAGAPATRTYEAPRPMVIERGTGGQITGSRSVPDSRPQQAPRIEVRPAPQAPAPPPASQRPDNRRPSGSAMQQSDQPIAPTFAAPERAPAYLPPASRTDSSFGARSYAPGRWQAPAGSSAAAPAPSWGGARPQAVRPSAPSGWQAPSWGRSGSQPSASPGFSAPARSAPSFSGGAAAARAKNH